MLVNPLIWVASHKKNFLPLSATTAWLVRISNASDTLVWFSEVPMKKILTIAAMFSALALTPASAKMMSCSGENMMKSSAGMGSMMEGPAKWGMNKELAAANMDMSKGNMRGACMHYMKAQKMGMMKSKM
jgi:hypothetical protein